jgi:hypothetical protein
LITPNSNVPQHDIAAHASAQIVQIEMPLTLAMYAQPFSCRCFVLIFNLNTDLSWFMRTPNAKEKAISHKRKEEATTSVKRSWNMSGTCTPPELGRLCWPVHERGCQFGALQAAASSEFVMGYGF